MLNTLVSDIAGKRVCVIIGPVGSGKFALAKLLAGELEAKGFKTAVSGEIERHSQEELISVFNLEKVDRQFFSCERVSDEFFALVNAQGSEVSLILLPGFSLRDAKLFYPMYEMAFDGMSQAQQKQPGVSFDVLVADRSAVRFRRINVSDVSVNRVLSS